MGSKQWSCLDAGDLPRARRLEFEANECNNRTARWTGHQRQRHCNFCFKFWLCNAIFENYFKFSSFFLDRTKFSASGKHDFVVCLRWSWAAKACTECCWLCLGKTAPFEVAVRYGLPSKNETSGSSFWKPRSSFTQASTGARLDPYKLPLADIMVPKHFHAELLLVCANALGLFFAFRSCMNRTKHSVFAFQTLQSQTARVQNS